MSSAPNLDQIKQLREETGLGVMDCKKAIDTAGGDIAKARELLKSKGREISARKSSRAANQGSIASYIHLGGKIGALVEINCETDFVARNDVFQAFARNICLQVVASRPKYVRAEEVPGDELASLKEWWRKDFAAKPAQIQEKILEGKAAEYYQQVVLLNQPYIKEPEKTVQDYLNETIARIGENISVRRFVRMEVGE